ncbi:MAG: 16S rRNA (cytidine(1402)-2'-O)-methyltransferase [Chloroflexi bacterium]|nr:16S rRNA (cytidine(1402)-2'-O)-methyltransferase [Chloroflexota bacterium]
MMLYIVSTPIGNPDDISLRALRILREAKTVICEERREGARLLRYYQIDNAIVELNEHTEREFVPELIGRLRRGETLALISDHGTPLLADPGGRLVKQAIAEGIPVSAVPGASSLLAALVGSGMSLERFRFIGFLPAKKEDRRAALNQLRNERDTWIVFDTPYRLSALLTDLRGVLGAERRMVVACSLTMPEENFVRGTAQQVVEHFQKHPFKGEFVVIVEGKNRN